MAADATNTIHDILWSAREEFLAHGFAGASLRKIAAGANVTTGALYSHFADKETLFNSLVEPAYTEVISMFKRRGDEFIRLLDSDGMGTMWEQTEKTLDFLIRYIYAHFDAFKLLVSASEQTVYESFTHELIQLDVDMTLEYLNRAREKGDAVRELSEDEIHMLSSAQYSAIFELILHGLSEEQAFRYAKTFWEFFSGGWRRLFGEA